MYCSNLPLNLSDYYGHEGDVFLKEREVLFESNLDSGISRKCLRFVTENENEHDELEKFVLDYNGIVLNTIGFSGGINFSSSGSPLQLIWLTTVLFPSDEDAVLAKLKLA